MREKALMKMGDNGSIIMESRYSDLEPLMEILEEWLHDHPEDENFAIAEQLHGILEVMHMSW